MDPVGVLLGKVDKETNLNKPEGSLPLKGALFKVKFYAGVQMVLTRQQVERLLLKNGCSEQMQMDLHTMIPNI